MIALANADSRHIPLADQSVQCVITSPPYWGLRSYNTGDNKHMEIGCEPTPALYVASIVAVMREVWRVLKDDGVLWLNLGDSYAGSGKGPTGYNGIGNQTARQGFDSVDQRIIDGLKPKDLCGIPWRVAFALQDDGWYLRQDIIWHKPNPMPESVTDRCTKSHEYVFLLSKSARYYYDNEAIKEDGNISPVIRDKSAEGYMADYPNARRFSDGVRQYGVEGKRNRRSVWTVATSPYSGAHFATFPPAL